MSVKSLVVVCDWCEERNEVEFTEEVSLDEISLVEASWGHLEMDGGEYDFCSKDCLRSWL